MVKMYAIIMQLRGYPSIAIASFVAVIYLTDCSPGIIIAIRF